MEYTVEITQEDIDTTKEFHSPVDCAMAKAMSRAIPGFESLVVEYFYMTKPGDRFTGMSRVDLPEAAAAWNAIAAAEYNSNDFLRQTLESLTFVQEVD